MLFLFLLGTAFSMEMMDPGERPEFHPINPGSKTFHWLVSLLLLLILSSISTILSLANKKLALLLQLISASYSLFESLFLSFPDSNNHENSVSHYTSWILSITLILTLVSSLKLPKIHKFLSILLVIIAWVRVCLAPVALFGFCYGKHTGQCIAHGIMGSAFIGYSFVLALLLIIPWFRINGFPYPQEFYDSSVIMVWGIVNTFTEHRWGKEGWSMGDYQHTAMGIIWWAGGLLGMWLGRKSRNFVPGIILIFTGFSMSQHAQHLEISTKIHSLFGIALMGAGLLRVIEISFLLNDTQSSTKILSFQHLPPFLLTLSGTLFMSANEEQLILVNDLGADASAYFLVASSAAFMIYLWFQLLLNFYLHLEGYDENGQLDKYDDIRADEFELSSVTSNATDDLRE